MINEDVMIVSIWKLTVFLKWNKINRIKKYLYHLSGNKEVKNEKDSFVCINCFHNVILIQRCCFCRE